MTDMKQFFPDNSLFVQTMLQVYQLGISNTALEIQATIDSARIRNDAETNKINKQTADTAQYEATTQRIQIKDMIKAKEKAAISDAIYSINNGMPRQDVEYIYGEFLPNGALDEIYNRKIEDDKKQSESDNINRYINPPVNNNTSGSVNRNPVNANTQSANNVTETKLVKEQSTTIYPKLENRVLPISLFYKL